MKRLNECALSPSSSSSSSSSRTVAGECTSSTSSTATIAPPKPKRRKEAPDAGEVLLGAPAVTTAPPLAMHDPVDVVRRTITFSASAGSSSSGGRGFVEARGIDSGNGGCEMTRVQLRYEEISWAAVVRGRATHIAYNASLCAVSCSDSSLVVLDFRSGRALLPKINLGGGGVAVLLEASKTRHLAVVTSTRELSVFDVFERRALVSRALVDPAVLRSSDTDLSLTVTSAGVAVLSCAAVQMAYDPALGAWVYVARKLRASALERPRDPAADHALALWEAEQELALADLLEDKNAHKAALLAYTRLLVDGSDEARLRVLFDDILHSKATEHVVAFTTRSRKDILQELLVITAKNRKLQRLCEEFSASLEESAGTDDDDPWGIPL